MPYELYEVMMQEYKNGSESEFIASVRNWLEVVKNNPFEDEEGHRLFFKTKKYFRNWRNGGIDMRSAKRNMTAAAKELCELNLPNPHDPNEIIEEPVVEEPVKKNEEQRFEKNEDIEVIQDIRYVMLAMVKAYNEGNEINFKQFAIHLVDIAEENPFEEGTEEFNIFAEMVMSYRKKPSNIRRVHVLAEKLCELINATEIPEPKKVINEPPKKVLGVIPEEEKEKKSWFKFLHPWKKDGEDDDN